MIYDHVILVLKGVSLDVPKGGIVALLGANGAGKTTTLKAISNLLHAERGDVTKGSILFEGDEVQDLSPNELVRRGCIQVMEGRQCFAHLTIEENLLTGAFTRRDGKAAIRRDIDLVYSYFPKLAERRDSLAGYTSGGEQQMCAVGRALMSRPKMILLDEPSMGLAPQIVEEIFEIVKDLNEREGVSFLLAEQNTHMALRFARYGYILENGRVVMDGDAKSLAENEDVKEFYLGISEGKPQIVPRRQALPPAQAGWLARDATPMRRPLRRSGNPPPGSARQRGMRRAAQDRRACHDRAGLGQASRRRRSEIGHLARGAGQAAGAAQIRHRRVAEGKPAVRRPQRHAARQGAPAADVAGADLRAGRRRARTGTAPRARCSPPASAPATSCTIPSPITSRPAASFWSRAATRSAARSFPAASAIPSSSWTRSRITSRPAMSARRIS